MQRAPNLPSVLIILGLAFTGFAWLAVERGTDVNWDLRNYHLYAPFAVWHGKLGYDLFPAQLQTFLNPLLDLLLEPFRALLNTRPVLLAVLLSIPNAVAATLAIIIALRLLSGSSQIRTPLAVVAGLFGATGAGALPELATSIGDVLPAAFILGGVVFLLPALEDQGVLVRRASLAGLMLGVALALKLTVAPMCAGLFASLAIFASAGLGRRITALAVLCVSAGALCLLLSGWWWWTLYHQFSNPLFPFYNNIFHSPFYPFVAVRDARFLPGGLADALAYPFRWAVDRRALVTELEMRDPRFALAWFAVFACLIEALLSLYPRYRALRPSRAASFLLLFFVISFVLWEAEFSILRYIVALEMLTGVLIMLPLLPLLRQSSAAWRLSAVAGLAALFIVVQRETVYPDWGHVPFGRAAIDVAMPTLPPDSTVILLDSSPMAYLATLARPSVRFIGANSNIVRLGQNTRLNELVADAIRDASGPLWGLQGSDALPVADATLTYYGLQREGPCAPINSNLDNSAIQLCKLRRAGAAG